MEWIKLHVFPKLMVETPVDGRNVRKLASARVKRSLNTSLEKDELPKKIIEVMYSLNILIMALLLTFIF